MLDDLVLGREDPTHAADVAHRGGQVDIGVAECQPEFVFQLPAARLYDDEAPRSVNKRAEGLDREGPQSDGAEEPYLEALCPVAP